MKDTKLPKVIKVDGFEIEWDNFYSITPLRKGLKTSSRTLYNLISSKRLTAARLGGRLKVHGASIIMYFNKRSRAQQKKKKPGV